MNDMQSIFDLQMADLHISDIQSEIADITVKLSSDGDLLTINSRLEKINEALDIKESDKKSKERVISDLENKITELQGLLYDGVITNEKELQALEEQKVYATGELSSKEDDLLELMIEIEKLVDSRDKHRFAVDKLMEKKSSDLIHLSAKQKDLTATLDKKQSERETLVCNIPPDILALYEKLKKNKSGQAVSKLEGRLCGVCRVELPVKELQDAKAGVRLVQCNSCRRIIYVS
ncbi:MAG: C4-type zinc ribbon domain-containing protein [Chloroflexota bacterium]|jgi:predicted  nucleic acid-binding Zn-ribbon protein